MVEVDVKVVEIPKGIPRPRRTSSTSTDEGAEVVEVEGGVEDEVEVEEVDQEVAHPWRQGRRNRPDIILGHIEMIHW